MTKPTTMPTFQGSLAQKMTEFVMFKQMEGFDYIVPAMALKRFDSFLCIQGYNRANLSRQIVEDYVSDTSALTPNGRYTWLSAVRVFSRYLHHLDPNSFVLHSLPSKRPSLPRWYLYSPGDISTLLKCSQALRKCGGALRPYCYQMLIGLLSVTGLRISEALALNLEDLDIQRGLLHVRRGKFGKERYVVLHDSTVEAVEEYLCRRAACPRSGTSTPFFLNGYGEALTYSQASGTFRRMVKRAGIGREAPQLPRLHDLRHTYACNCLLKWYDEGADVNSKLPILATAMGHVNIEATQIYLHVTSCMLEKAAQRLHDKFSSSSNAQA